MKNDETSKNVQTVQPQELQTRRDQDTQKEHATRATASRWLSLVNDKNAWLKKDELSVTRHYPTYIDPREFLGTAPPFSWE